MKLVMSIPPVYLIAGIILVVAVILIVSRSRIRQILKRTRLEEFTVGPLKFGLSNKTDENDQSGVSFGIKNDFSGAEITDVVAGNRGPGTQRQNKHGERISFGEENVFKETIIRNLTGGDKISDDSE
jgi:hypothetical protein